MFRKNIIIFLVLSVSVFSIGCTEEDEFIPGLKGNMVGYIYTFDEFGNLLDDHSDVRIIATGIDKQYRTLTDSKGRFELTGLPTGTYELNFVKEGFGLLKQFGVQHLGGTPTILLNYSSYNLAYFLYEMPTTKITNLTIENDTIYGEFSFTAQNKPGTIYLRLFFSTIADFSIQSAQYVQNRWLTKNESRYLRSTYFKDAPFHPGEEVFFKACIYTQKSCIQLQQFTWMTIYGIDMYYDYKSNTTIYPNLSNESAQFSFIFQE